MTLGFAASASTRAPPSRLCRAAVQGTAIHRSLTRVPEPRLKTQLFPPSLCPGKTKSRMGRGDVNAHLPSETQHHWGKTTAVLPPGAWYLLASGHCWKSILPSFQTVDPVEPATATESFPFGGRTAPRILYSIAKVLMSHRIIDYFPSSTQFSLIQTPSSSPTKSRWLSSLVCIDRIIASRDCRLHGRY